MVTRDRLVLVPLRLFLGVTFVYAGLQKLADKWFFKASAPSSLQSQLHAAARTSPVGGLVGPLQHHAVIVGLLIAFGELASGVGTLIGLWTRVAAVAGALLSFGFLLTVSWHSRPYYYGADVVFLFAWTPLIIAGAGPLSLDAIVADRTRAELGVATAVPVTIGFDTVQRLCGYYDKGRCRAQHGRKCRAAGCPVLAGPEIPAAVGEELDRRSFLAKAGMAGWIGGAAALVGGLAALVGRLVPSHGTSRVASSSLNAGPTTPATQPATQPATPTTGAAGPSTPATAGPSPTSAPTTAAPTAPVAGVRIGPASAVPVGGAASYTDPGSGDPAFVVQPKAGTFVSFDATCTHQGCPVEFAGSVFQCPCHGAEFDSHTGAVVRGPATQPLSPITVREGPDGQLYVGR